MGRKSLLTAISLAVAVITAASQAALAAGFAVRENSAEAVATSYAGNGSRADAANTAFSNPAGLPLLRGSELEAGAAVILPSMRFKGRAQLRGSQIGGDDGGDSGLSAAVPNMYAVLKLNDDVGLGMAVTAPFGNANEYGSNWVGRYLGLKTAARSVDINPSIGVRINDVFSLGAGISAQYLKLDVSSAIPQAVIFQSPAPDGIYRFQAHDWAFGFNLGLIAQVDDSTRLGLTYRSAVDHNIKGRLDFAGVSPLLGMVNSPASAKARLPATSGLSITSQIAPDLTLSADIQFSQWSGFRQVVIRSQNPPFVNDENYRDSWMIAAGGTYRLDDAWLLRAGLAWDQTPVVSRFRAVSLPDGDRYLLGLGASYQWSDHIVLDGAYGHSFALYRPNMNSSVNSTDPITHAITLSGAYSVAVDILALSARYKY